MKYGYARVSPGGKSESVDAQARQLTKAGCKKVFRDVYVTYGTLTPGLATGLVVA